MPSKILPTSSARRDGRAHGERPTALPYPSLFAVACHWADPWLVGTGTRPGNRHYYGGAPSEDALLVTRCGPHILLAIADGASDPAATRSGEGAHRAVAMAAAEANRSYPVIGLDLQLLVEAMAAAHVDLVGRAKAEGVHPHAFACTLNLVLLAGDHIMAARVGDGSMYTWDGRSMARFCSAPLPDATTPMLVSSDWRRWLATADEERPFTKGLALCSDGADDFFLADRPSRPGAAPSDAMFKGLVGHCDTYGPLAAVNFAMQMLNEPRFAAKADDDRSVILAFKPQSPQAIPPRGKQLCPPPP